MRLLSTTKGLKFCPICSCCQVIGTVTAPILGKNIELVGDLNLGSVAKMLLDMQILDYETFGASI